MRIACQCAAKEGKFNDSDKGKWNYAFYKLLNWPECPMVIGFVTGISRRAGGLRPQHVFQDRSHGSIKASLMAEAGADGDRPRADRLGRPRPSLP